mgnify:CR=1 FL=1|jgi:hypothetical protein
MCDELGLNCYLDDALEEFKHTSKDIRLKSGIVNGIESNHAFLFCVELID